MTTEIRAVRAQRLHRDFRQAIIDAIRPFGGQIDDQTAIAITAHVLGILMGHAKAFENQPEVVRAIVNLNIDQGIADARGREGGPGSDGIGPIAGSA